MIVLREASANDLFAEACRLVSRRGRPVNPRGLATREVLGVHLCLTNPRRRLVDVPPVRVLNPAFAVAEAVWILSGSDDPWIFDYNRALRRYTDGGRLRGAYGPRLRRWGGEVDQLDRVRQLLLRDPDSRQAVVQLFDPGQDWAGHRDVPCTVGYRFFIRSGRLHMHTTMRSQDLWLGFPYDVFTATVLHELLAGWLGVELGEYQHHVDSLHLYETDSLHATQLPPQPAPSPEMARLVVGWPDLDGMLAGVLAGDLEPHIASVWSELAQVLASYRAWRSGDRAGARAAIADPGRWMLLGALARWYDHLTARADDQESSKAGSRS
jgi:thymidylate synthase